MLPLNPRPMRLFIYEQNAHADVWRLSSPFCLQVQRKIASTNACYGRFNLQDLIQFQKTDVEVSIVKNERLNLCLALLWSSENGFISTNKLERIFEVLWNTINPICTEGGILLIYSSTDHSAIRHCCSLSGDDRTRLKRPWFELVSRINYSKIWARTD